MSLFLDSQTNFEHTFAAKVTFLSNTFFGSDVTISEASKLTVSSISSFEKQVTFTDSVAFVSNITVDRLLATSVVVSGITTVGDIDVTGRLLDGDGDFGTAGQVLSSDGTDLEWINTSSANVGSATNVGTNLDNTDADQWITFIGANSGNNPTRVDDNLRYNPSTNTMSGINYSGTSRFTNIRIDGQLLDGDGDFGSSGQVLASDGTDTNWVNTGSLTAGAASQVGVTDTDDNTDFHPTFVASTSGNDNIRVDSDLTYNASTNTLTAGTFSGNASASNLNTGTIPNARFPSTLPAISGANLTNLDASDLASGTIPDARFPSVLPAVDGSNLTGIEGVPSGIIAMWSGAINSLPSGWVLCNGSNNTPDLRDRFIVGAGNNYNIGNTGGADTVTLTTDQIPSHTHTYSRAASPGGGQDQAGSGSGDAVNHSNQNTSSTGGGQAHENRPPYYALAYIMKT